MPAKEVAGVTPAPGSWRVRPLHVSQAAAARDVSAPAFSLALGAAVCICTTRLKNTHLLAPSLFNLIFLLRRWR